MSTGYLYHEIFGWHDTGTFTGDLPSNPEAGLQPYMNYENADTKRRIHELIVVSGLINHLERIPVRKATDSELETVHTKSHIENIKSQSATRLGGDAGDLTTPFAHGGYEIAAMAAGGAIEMFDAVLNGKVKNGYALIRPPGHHAVRERGMGYCIFSNLAVAIAVAKRNRSNNLRVVVVDWDVHHGNGTESIFIDDPNVLTRKAMREGSSYLGDQGYYGEQRDAIVNQLNQLEAHQNALKQLQSKYNIGSTFFGAPTKSAGAASPITPDASIPMNLRPRRR